MLEVVAGEHFFRAQYAIVLFMVRIAAGREIRRTNHQITVIQEGEGLAFAGQI